MDFSLFEKQLNEYIHTVFSKDEHYKIDLLLNEYKKNVSKTVFIFYSGNSKTYFANLLEPIHQTITHFTDIDKFCILYRYHNGLMIYETNTESIVSTIKLKHKNTILITFNSCEYKPLEFNFVEFISLRYIRKTYMTGKYGIRLEMKFIKRRNKNINNELIFSPDLSFYKDRWMVLNDKDKVKGYYQVN